MSSQRFLPTRLWMVVIAVFAGGLCVGMFMPQWWAAPPADIATSTARYVCPMHPHVTSERPGTCPICGMALVARDLSGDKLAEGAPAVYVEPQMVQSLGVRTAKVRRRSLSVQLEMPGTVQQVTALTHSTVPAPLAGRVARIVAAVGATVQQQDALLEIESPELLAAQNEHLKLLDAKNPATLENSQSRLQSLGMTPEQISALDETRRITPTVLVRAPQAGRVEHLPIAVGETVTTGIAVAELNQPAGAVVFVAALPSDALWLKPGARAELVVPDRPQRIWTGQVLSANLTNSAAGMGAVRNLAVTLHFDVADETLVNGMYVVVRAQGATRHAALTVPRDAVIRTGDGAHVLRALGGGHFSPTPVTPGIESGDDVEIAAGLKEGDEVVVSAQFLIDSEAGLQASFRRLEGVSAPRSHRH